MKIKRNLKHTIAGIIFPKYSYIIQSLNYNALLKEWLKKDIKTFKTRQQLYSYINSRFALNSSIDFLEFGVYQGDSLNLWINENDHEKTRFYGFDSFEGLPDNWGYSVKKGGFNVNGKLPEISDKRLTFIKGFFNDTLNNFLETFKPKNKMIIHIDCDLYDGSLYVLTNLDKFIKESDIIIFDEFFSSSHEFRAYLDYVSSYKRKLEPIGIVNDVHGRIAFKVL